MKIGIVSGKRTQELYSYLSLHCHNTADISILLPSETTSRFNKDIYILESPVQPLLTNLLSLENEPLIVILQDGYSEKNLRYCRDETQLTKLLESYEDNDPFLVLFQDRQKYLYPQKQIILLKQEHCVNLILKSGQTVLCCESFSKISSRLSRHLFFRAAENIYLNSLMVAGFSKDAVTMQNGMTIPVSPNDMPVVQNAFYKTKYYQNRTHP